jgi:hypothetical protein
VPLVATSHSAQRTAHSAQRTAHSAQRTAHSGVRAGDYAPRTSQQAGAGELGGGDKPQPQWRVVSALQLQLQSIGCSSAAATDMASFLLAVGPRSQSTELVFGGSPLGSHGGGMPARSGGSWSAVGGGEIVAPAGPWGLGS